MATHHITFYLLINNMNFSKENNQKCVHECMKQLKTIIDDYKKHNELDVSVRTLYLSVSQILQNRDQIEHYKKKIEEYKRMLEEHHRKLEENERNLKEHDSRIDALEELATFVEFNKQLQQKCGRSVRHFSEFSKNFNKLYKMDLAPDSLILKVQFNHVGSYCTHC